MLLVGCLFGNLKNWPSVLVFAIQDNFFLFSTHHHSRMGIIQSDMILFIVLVPYPNKRFLATRGILIYTA